MTRPLLISILFVSMAVQVFADPPLAEKESPEVKAAAIQSCQVPGNEVVVRSLTSHVYFLGIFQPDNKISIYACIHQNAQGQFDPNSPPVCPPLVSEDSGKTALPIPLSILTDGTKPESDNLFKKAGQDIEHGAKGFTDFAAKAWPVGMALPLVGAAGIAAGAASGPMDDYFSNLKNRQASQALLKRLLGCNAPDTWNPSGNIKLNKNGTDNTASASMNGDPAAVAVLLSAYLSNLVKKNAAIAMPDVSSMEHDQSDVPENLRPAPLPVNNSGVTAVKPLDSGSLPQGTVGTVPSATTPDATSGVATVPDDSSKSPFP